MFLGIRFFLFHIFKSIYMGRFSKEFADLRQEQGTFRKWRKIARFYLNDNTVYYACFALFACLGLWLHVFFFAFHLYEVMNQFQTCRIFIQSITKPYKQLIFAFIFYNILIFEYAVVGYLFYWKYYRPTEGDHPGNYCDSLLECYLTVFDQTNKEPGGIGSFLDIVSGPEAAFNNRLRVVHDVSFRFIVPIILLSIVKGIIVDTFGALREEDQEKTEDMESRCFVCGLEK